MAESATISDPHVRVGLVAGDGGTVAWPLAVGPMLAKRYLLTGDPVDAADGRCGSGSSPRSCPTTELDERGDGASPSGSPTGAPLAIRYTKQAVNALVKDAALRAPSTSPPRSRS